MQIKKEKNKNKKVKLTKQKKKKEFIPQVMDYYDKEKRQMMMILN